MICKTGKVQYSSIESARRHARTKTGGRVRAYKCPYCHGIHITTQSKRSKK